MMILHAFSMGILYIISKKVSHDLHSFQIAFLYKALILIGIFPWCLHGGLKKNLKTKRLGMHVARGTFSLLGTLCFFVAMKSLPASNVAAIGYLDHIVLIFIGVLYFKEKLYNHKIVAILSSFTGAFLIIKPWIGSIDHNYVFLFLAVGFWSINSTIIKILGATEKTKAQLFYVMFFSAVFSLPLALHEWREVEAIHWKYLGGLAVCYLIHSVAFFKAFKYADVSMVLPFDYTRLIFTGLLGMLFLNEVPDDYAITGYILIILGGIYTILAESKRNHKLSEAKKLELEAKYDQA
jgi:drug/metabolite transporter (DMT)-like permease